MFCTDSTPPPEFIWANLTQYQQHTINEKLYIYNYVNDSKNSKMYCFKELARELGKNYTAVRNVFYAIR